MTTSNAKGILKERFKQTSITDHTTTPPIKININKNIQKSDSILNKGKEKASEIKHKGRDIFEAMLSKHSSNRKKEHVFESKQTSTSKNLIESLDREAEINQQKNPNDTIEQTTFTRQTNNDIDKLQEDYTNTVSQVSDENYPNNHSNSSTLETIPDKLSASPESQYSSTTANSSSIDSESSLCNDVILGGQLEKKLQSQLDIELADTDSDEEEQYSKDNGKRRIQKKVANSKSTAKERKEQETKEKNNEDCSKKERNNESTFNKNHDNEDQNHNNETSEVRQKEVSDNTNNEVQSKIGKKDVTTPTKRNPMERKKNKEDIR